MEALHNRIYPQTIDSNAPNAHLDFAYALSQLLFPRPPKQEVVFVCIGTDRATGDSLGPLVGHMLFPHMNRLKGATLYGTLQSPVHARNLQETLAFIECCRPKPLVVAVDAALGRADHIGWLKVGPGPVCPGAGLSKNLPPVGDIAITGIVNSCSVSGFALLQSARLHVVMQMADCICKGFIHATQK